MSVMTPARMSTTAATERSVAGSTRGGWLRLLRERLELRVLFLRVAIGGYTSTMTGNTIGRRRVCS